MNRKEWVECKNRKIKYQWYHKTEKIRKTLKYNNNPKAIHKHHLFNTPEQIAYNNEHYEMWGFNLDGTFEYGKYIVFVTPEEHNKIHSESEITKQRIRENLPDRHGKNNPMYGKHTSALQKQRTHDIFFGKQRSEEIKQKISNAMKGERHWNYGKNLSEEYKKKISESIKGRILSEEHKLKIGLGNRGKIRSEEYRKKMSEIKKNISAETKKKISDALKGIKQPIEQVKKRTIKIRKVSDEYKKYKNNGGSMSWNEFQKNYKTYS